MRRSLAALAALTAAYVVTSRVHLYAPWAPGWSAADRAIPFVEAAYFVYASHYLLVAAGLLALPPADQPAARRRMLWATAAAAAFFVLLPVETPAAPAAPAGLGPRLIHAFLMRADTQANSFPSLHAALALLSAWALGGSYPAGRRWASAWGWAVALSTVLTKRHLAADLAGGVALAYACRALVR